MSKAIENESKLKSYLVNYASLKKNMEQDKVTVEMIIESITEDFPELVLAVAEENWIRGYHQALVDVETTEVDTEIQPITDLDEET
tara:strand:- start:15 stop:272 length:258 start_codon:yes stop_codon:yes gene_type:complete